MKGATSLRLLGTGAVAGSAAGLLAEAACPLAAAGAGARALTDKACREGAASGRMARRAPELPVLGRLVGADAGATAVAAPAGT